LTRHISSFTKLRNSLVWLSVLAFGLVIGLMHPQAAVSQEKDMKPPMPTNTFRVDILTPLEGAEIKPWLNAFSEKVRTKWGPKLKEFAVYEDKGIVLVRLTLIRNGYLVQDPARIEYSSGRLKLDDASLGTVLAAAPFEPFPENLKSEKMELRITFRYAYLPDAPFKDLYDAAQKAVTIQDYTLAVQLFEVLLERDPDYTNGWNYLGWVYNKLGKYDKAVAALKRALEQDPRDVFAHNNLGQAYAGLKDYDAAILQHQKQLEINKNDKFAHTNLGKAYLEKQDYPKAIEELEAATVNNPKDAGLYYILGRAYLKSNQREKSKDAFKKSAELEPVPMRLNNIAYQMALAELDLPAAQGYAESGIAALVLKMRDVSIERPGVEDIRMTAWIAMLWDTLGWIMFERGKLAEAKSYVSGSWQLHAVGEVGYHLGRIYEAEGRKDEAIQVYLLSLGAAQPNPDARERLAKLLGNDGEIDKRVEESRPLLTAIRAISIPNTHKADGVAEFWILLAPGPRVLGVKFITGDEILRMYTKELETANYPIIFPEATDLRLLRRGRLNCSPVANEPCRLLLASTETVRSLD
jgi:tetratricopeptide (TPR) repeat protein